MRTTIASPLTISFQPSLLAKDQQVIQEQEVLPSSPSSASDARIRVNGQSNHEDLQAATSSSPSQPFPQTQSALVVTANRSYAILTDFPAPQPTDLGPHEVLIRTRSAGLNHIDWKSVDYNYCLPSFPWITGREMSGIVEGVGSAVSGVEIGEAVWTSTYYKDRRAGCFQDLVVVPQHTVFQIPQGLSFEAAACLGVPAVTAAMTLWRWLEVPMSDAGTTLTRVDSPREQEQREILLVWGASTTTGQFTIQLAAQAGLEIIAVCSESTAAIVKSLGATHIVTYTGKSDYHLIGEVLSLAQGRLGKAIDIVGANTAALVLEIIKACGDEHTVDFAPLGFMAKGQVVPKNARLRDVQMKQFILDKSARVYGERLNDLLEAGKLRMPRLRVLPGGVWAVEEGLDAVKNGSLAGEKLVVSWT